MTSYGGDIKQMFNENVYIHIYIYICFVDTKYKLYQYSREQVRETIEM